MGGGWEGLALLQPSCRVGLEIRGGPHLCRWRNQHDPCLSKLHKQSRGGLQNRGWGKSPGMAETSRNRVWEPLEQGAPAGSRTPSLGSPYTCPPQPHTPGVGS